MIFSSQTRHDTPIIGITIDGVPVDYTTISKVEIDFTENMHDMATLTFIGLAPSLVLGYVERPVHITFGSDAYDLAEFYGYITYLEPVNQTNLGLKNGSLFQDTKAYCLGTSYDMKSQKTWIWENVTLPQLVNDISSTYRYTSEVPDDNFVFPRVVQSGESDWAVLVRTAQRMGYSVTCHGAHIRVIDPLRALALNSEYVTLESLIGAGNDPTNRPGRILKFQGSFGKVTTEGDSSSQSLGFLDRSGAVATTDTPDYPQSGMGRPYGSRFTNDMAINADSGELANKLVEAKTRYNMPFNATVEVKGTATPKPGSVVNLHKYNAAFDGFWFVRSVKHSIIRSTFFTEMKLSKDSTNDDPIRLQPPRGQYLIPEPIVIKDQWVASREGSYAY